jgi:hypothetical protein
MNRLFYTSVLAITGLLLATTAWSHPVMIDACFRGPVSAVKIGEKANENGLLSELYDRNGDGQIDIEIMTPIKGVKQAGDKEPIYEHDSHPLFFAVDTSKDMTRGEPDTLYIDRYGKGQCSGIVVYKDLTKPHMPDKDHRDSAAEVGGGL